MSDEIRSWDAAAAAYDAWVISPFAPDVDFPVRNHVRRLLDTWKQRGELRRRVAFGCGCGKGQALTLIAGQVGFACGLDFSPRMLDLSERLLKTRGISPSRYPHRGDREGCPRWSRLWGRQSTGSSSHLIWSPRTAPLRPSRRTVPMPAARLRPPAVGPSSEGVHPANGDRLS